MLKRCLVLTLLLPSLTLADSMGASGDNKLTVQAHVDFKIIIPLVMGVNDGKANINSYSKLVKTCDANNVCTVSSP